LRCRAADLEGREQLLLFDDVEVLLARSKAFCRGCLPSCSLGHAGVVISLAKRSRAVHHWCARLRGVAGRCGEDALVARAFRLKLRRCNPISARLRVEMGRLRKRFDPSPM